MNISDLLGHRCLLWGVAGSGRHALAGLAVASWVICPSTSSVLNMLLCKYLREMIFSIVIKKAIFFCENRYMMILVPHWAIHVPYYQGIGIWLSSLLCMTNLSSLVATWKCKVWHNQGKCRESHCNTQKDFIWKWKTPAPWETCGTDQ